MVVLLGIIPAGILLKPCLMTPEGREASYNPCINGISPMGTYWAKNGMNIPRLFESVGIRFYKMVPPHLQAGL